MPGKTVPGSALDIINEGLAPCRMDAVAFTHRGDLYLFGGETRHGRLEEVCWRGDRSPCLLTCFTRDKECTDRQQRVCVKAQKVTVGAMTGSGRRFKSAELLVKYSEEEERFLPLQDLPPGQGEHVPAQRSPTGGWQFMRNASICVQRDRLFVFGGAYQAGTEQQQAMCTDMHSCDLLTMQWQPWTQIGSVPKQRLAQHSVLVGSRMYIYGPHSKLRTASGLEDGNTMDWFDFTTNTFFKTQTVCRSDRPLPQQHQVQAVSCYQERFIYALSSTLTPDDGRLEVWRLDLTTRDWELMETGGDTLPERHQFAAVAWSGSWFLHGGRTVRYDKGGLPVLGQANNSIYAFDFGTHTWRHVGRSKLRRSRHAAVLWHTDEEARILLLSNTPPAGGSSPAAAKEAPMEMIVLPQTEQDCLRLHDTVVMQPAGGARHGGADGSAPANRTLLFDMPELSDCTVACSGRCWKVHRTILALHSRVFYCMFANDMAERSSGSVEIDCDSPDAVEAMLMWMYAHVDNVACNMRSTTVAELFMLAQRYDIAQLTWACVAVFEQHLQASNLAFFQHLATRHSCEALEAAVNAFLLRFACNQDLTQQLIMSASFLELMGADPALAQRMLVRVFEQVQAAPKAAAQFQQMLQAAAPGLATQARQNLRTVLHGHLPPPGPVQPAVGGPPAPLPYLPGHAALPQRTEWHLAAH